MKKVIILCNLICCFTTAYTQYCGNSAPFQCLQIGTLTKCGLSPTSESTSPFINGQYGSKTIQILAPDSLRISNGGGSYSVISTVIDSITNLPLGLCWATNKLNNIFGSSEQGCISFTGTPCGLNGQYKPKIYMTVNSTFPLPLKLVNGSLQFDYSYFLRVKNPLDSITAIDTVQSNSIDFVPYGTVPVCGQFMRFEPTLVSAGNVCEGGLITASILTRNIPFSNSNFFKLELSGVAFINGSPTVIVFNTDSIQANLDGTYSFRVPDSLYLVSCGQSVTYDLFFHSTDSAIRKPLGTMRVFESPFATNVASQNACENSPIILGEPFATCNNTYAWYHSFDTIPFSLNSSISVSLGSTAQYRVRVSNGGCNRDSFFTLTWKPSPIISPMDTSVSTCPGDSARIGPDTLNSSYSFSWSSQSGYFSSNIHPVISPSVSEIYVLSVVDSNYCTATKTVIVSNKQPPAQELCMVTVDSLSNHNVLIWEKVDKKATDSFLIYKETTSNNYVQIASIYRDSLSEFHDLFANPNATAYRYKISVIDTCGNRSQLSAFHNSMHLQYLGGGNIQWNTYEIEWSATPVLSYDVYRDTAGNGIWSQILTISGSQNTATDPDYSRFQNAKYRVQANWGNTCTSSRSMYRNVVSNTITNKLNSLQIIGESVLAVSPNPTKGNVLVCFSKPCFGSIQLNDITGKLILASSLNGEILKVINLAALNAGVYILTYKDNGTSFSKKIIKE